MKFENKSKNNKMDNLDVSYENLKQTCDEKNNKINKCEEYCYDIANNTFFHIST